MRGSAAQISIFAVAAILMLVIFGRIVHERDFAAGSLTDEISNVLGRPTIRSIMENSERMWAKTVQQRNELRGRVYAEHDIGMFPAVTQPLYFTYPWSIWDMVPASYNCPFEVERIGRMGDGGKWVCGMSRYEKSRRPTIMYSMGIQNESSFEQEMMERTNTEIWAYDFSVTDVGPAILPTFRPRVHFKQIGISGETALGKDPPFYTIQDLMKQNNHDYIDILKIDVEYAEFEALSSLELFTRTAGVEFPIGQILIEIHLFKGDGFNLNGPRFLDWWASFEARGMRPTWTEPNLLAVTMELEDGMPRLAEYTWINTMDKRNKLWR